MSNLLTVQQAAARIGASQSLIQRRCKDGTIRCIRVGDTYRIQQADLDAWGTFLPQATRRDQPPAQEDLLALIDDWVEYLAHIRALAPTTIETHRGSVLTYIKRIGTCKPGNISTAILFDRKSLQMVFAKIPPQSFALKLNTFNALVSFGKYLVEEGHLQQAAVDAIRPLKPRRQVEPRRTHLKAEEVERMFEIVLTRNTCTMRENITLAALLSCMVYAGLRASEVCNLRVIDVDLDARILTVHHGKGGKDRRVGISNSLLGYLHRYQEIRPMNRLYFVGQDGSPWNRHKLAKRVKQFSNRMGVDITCHGLRRTFATLAANHGRSVNAIRIALGHADLTTTQAYLRQSENEVVAAMRDW